MGIGSHEPMNDPAGAPVSPTLALPWIGPMKVGER
jgi:hypothetical protein